MLWINVSYKFIYIKDEKWKLVQCFVTTIYMSALNVLISIIKYTLGDVSLQT